MKIFVAGATDAVGLPLVRALRTLGHEISGMTRAGLGVDATFRIDLGGRLPAGQYTTLAVIAGNGNVMNPVIRRIPVVIASDR
jgi:nucleoside-diphosphate-sugar epimerase